MQTDTHDWVSIATGQKPRTRQEIEPFSATWRPDYERNGATSGIQIYAVILDGDSAVVLCLVGNTRVETAEGVTRHVWRGSHVRDTWTNTSTGWKRRRHEKLTVDEQMVDGRPTK